MRRTPLARGTRIKRTGRIKPKKRSSSEFQRIYGSKARVRWVKAQPCLVCGVTPSENAHVIGGGTGRKAAYDTIIPLCHHHHAATHQVGWAYISQAFNDWQYRLNLAAETERQWRRFAEED